MALTPSTNQNRENVLAQRRAAEEDVLLREVDDAVRQDQYSTFVQRYGKPLLALIAALLLGFAGYLFWDHRREQALERQSEEFMTAMDKVEAGQLDAGNTALTPLAASSDAGTRATAALLQGGIALEQGQRERAAKLFAAVAADSAAPAELRNLALIREIAVNFDTLPPQQVIDRLKPLAVPGNPWFGSAGELTAMAHLEAGNREAAGTLFSAVAKADDVPETLRSRARQVAGLLGVDAIEDVDTLLKEQGITNGASAAPAAAGAPAAAAE